MGKARTFAPESDGEDYSFQVFSPDGIQWS